MQKWITDLDAVKYISLPRCYAKEVCGEVRSVQLHGFRDASKIAFCAVVFIRIETDGGCYTSLIYSKPRVALLTNQSIPRLELLAGLTLARLVCTVKSALQPVVKIDNVYCWLDSLTAIYWILQEDKEWTPFVQNRVTEIQRLVALQFWFHCPTKENVADIASRGASPSELLSETRWWKGPTWLVMPKEEWPNLETPVSPTEEVVSEMKVSGKRKENQTVINLMTTASRADIKGIISCEKFSSIHRLLRVSVLVQRFVNNLKKSKSGEKKEQGPITTQEIEESENLWLKSVQSSMFEDRKYQQWRDQLGLFLDEQDLIRCKGRIEHADLPYTARHPVLLPQTHPFTDLAILDCHHRVGHNGVKETLSELRFRFRIIRGRQVVRRIPFRCCKCRRFEGNSYPATPPPVLPEFRVKDDPAFSSVAVDFAGPFYIWFIGKTE